LACSTAERLGWLQAVHSRWQRGGAKAFGEKVYKVAQEGKLAEVSYMFPRPGETTPTPKVSFVMKAGDQGCGVGYYK
jgi:hypothetical protein